MRIGLCTTDFDRAMPADELFGRVKRMGFTAVQLAFCSVAECGFAVSDHIEIPESVSESAAAAIRAASAKHGVAIDAVNGTFNMAHPDAAVREEGLRRFDGFLAGVRAIGCEMVSVCSGSRSRAGLWTFDPATAEPDAYADMAECMRRATRMAEERGVVLAIETEAANVIDTPETARRLLDEIGSPNLKMILDCANLFHAGEASAQAMRPRIDRAMRCFGRDVVIAHGKDIQPSPGIRFCGTGLGVVDFPYMLQSLSQSGFAGDMVLHGIYREEDMPGCLAFMRECFQKAGIAEE